MKIFYSFCFLFFTLIINAQSYINIKGFVTDKNKKPLSLVNVALMNYPQGTVTDSSGSFKLKIKSKLLPVDIIFSRIGYETTKYTLTSKNTSSIINIIMKIKKVDIEEVEVSANSKVKHNMQTIDSKIAEFIPDASGGIESLVKTQMGVSSNNELSSQYRVRGGNFDENLVYVNNIEVYRPQLVRSGKQEGLSFINPDLVHNIKFSAGGYDAGYGDKMSSVLDITYKKPTEFKGSISASLLGASGYVEGVSDNGRLSYIGGIRYKTNKYMLLNSDESGNYNPDFYDAQTYINYKISDKVECSFLGNMSINKYGFKPKDRESSFGTITQIKKLKIYFEGQEEDKFLTGFGAFSFNFKPNINNKYSFTYSTFRTSEDENFDIVGQYWVQDLEQVDSKLIENKKFAEGIGVGTYLEHARNYLFANISNFSFRANHNFGYNKILEWGLKYNIEHFSNNFNEWEMRDSADYIIPINDEEIKMIYHYWGKNNINNNRISGFVQHNRPVTWNNALLKFSIGIRGSYWDYNDEFILSPRVSVNIKPEWEKDFRFRLASGIYYQAPFFKEYQLINGKLNNNIKSQRAIHFVAGLDYYFKTANRPFKFTTELYYKKLDDLVSYSVDNVRIIYSGKNDAKGYAAGIDMKINGEFVEGIESWATLSFMKTEEDIINDSYINKTGKTIYPGYIPRPADQRVNFSLMFQDYLPNNPTFKVHLNFIYATGLSFGPPHSPRYLATARMPSYKRIDVGFSKDITRNRHEKDTKKSSVFKSFWIGLDIFNLFDIDNTISHFWVTDVLNRQYAVPNYLTSRRLKLKVIARF